MKIIYTRDMAQPDHLAAHKGDIREVDHWTGQQLIGDGYAAEAPDDRPRIEDLEPQPEVEGELKIAN